MSTLIVWPLSVLAWTAYTECARTEVEMQARYQSADTHVARFRYTALTVPRAKYNPLEIPNYTIDEASRYLLLMNKKIGGR